MKIRFAALLILGMITFQSCKETTPENDVKTSEISEKSENNGVTLIGTWTLYKEKIKGKQVDHSGNPTAVSLTFKENGFYIFFDKITDTKISDSGVDQIQERYKGQYEQTDNIIVMNHFIMDSLISKAYIIDRLTENELVLKEKDSKHEQYFKR